VIKLLKVRGFRCLKNVEFEPNSRRNILIGENASGKSTLLDAIGLVLTCRLDGRSASESLNPFWFNQEQVNEFRGQRQAGFQAELPTIEIEAFLEDRDEFQTLAGVNNSLEDTICTPGLVLRVKPNPEFAAELDQALERGRLIPTDFYLVEWSDFSGKSVFKRPKSISTAKVDSRTIRSYTGVDYQMKEILDSRLSEGEKASLSSAFREMKEELERNHLEGLNKDLGESDYTLGPEKLGLGMNQAHGSGWDSHIVPVVDELPFSQSGLGTQAAIKTLMAVERHAEVTQVLMIEEPENHLSHSTLNRLLSRIEEKAGENQQYFVATHSSFVLNRLGLDSLIFVSDSQVGKGFAISPESVSYFQRQPGYETLRLILADHSVLVEGPSDEMVFERFFRDRFGKRPIEMGIDVISVGGTSFKRGLELAAKVGKSCTVIRDNDGKPAAHWESKVAEFLSAKRRVFIGAPSKGQTLETQLIAANGDSLLREVLGLPNEVEVAEYMKNHKTDGAFAIAEASVSLDPPDYLREAIEFCARP